MRLARILCAAVALASAGSAQAAPLFADSEWHRLASPDGQVSALFPCTTAEATARSQDGGFAIECRKQGLLFVIASGMPSANPADQGKVLNFDYFYSDAIKRLPPEERRESMIGGHRAIAIVCPGRDGVPCIEIVDLAPGKPLIVGAPEVSLSAAQRAEGLAAGRKFYDSLEIGGQ